MRSLKLKTKPKPKITSLKFEAIGTWWDIEIYDRLSRAQVAALSVKIKQRIAEFDRHYSRFRDDSLVAEIAKRAGSYDLPADAQPLVDLYQQLYDLTDGAMTPLIGQVLSDAGYDASYSLQPKPMTSPPGWETALDYHFPKLVTRLPILLDFGAAGKGYLIDIVAELIAASGITSFLVDAGGDMIYRSDRGLEVGLENPDNALEVIGIATIHNQALCGSAGNRRTWGEFHHIIDPRSLVSPRHIQALWVVAETALLADGLATALFFVPAKKLLERYTFEYAIVHADRSLEQSSGFPGKFFTA